MRDIEDLQSCLIEKGHDPVKLAEKHGLLTDCSEFEDPVLEEENIQEFRSVLRSRLVG